MGKMLSLRQFTAQVAELVETTTVIKREPDGTQRIIGTWLPQDRDVIRRERPPDPESQRLTEDRVVGGLAAGPTFGKSKPAPKP